MHKPIDLDTNLANDSHCHLRATCQVLRALQAAELCIVGLCILKSGDQFVVIVMTIMCAHQLPPIHVGCYFDEGAGGEGNYMVSFYSYYLFLKGLSINGTR